MGGGSVAGRHISQNTTSRSGLTHVDLFDLAAVVELHLDLEERVARLARLAAAGSHWRGGVGGGFIMREGWELRDGSKREEETWPPQRKARSSD